MALDNIAVWSIPPDWADGVSETLQHLTAVSATPKALEQRLGLRNRPRQMFELSFTVHGPVRTLFDLLTIRAGGSLVYLPIWQDQERLRHAVPVGTTTLQIDVMFTQFYTSNVLILWASPFDYEIHEIASISDSGQVVELVTPVAKNWPAHTTFVYPVKRARFETQPTTSRRADGAFVARARFIVQFEDDGFDAIFVDGFGSGVYALPDQLTGIVDSPRFTLSYWVYRVGVGQIGGIGTDFTGNQIVGAVDFGWYTRLPENNAYWICDAGAAPAFWYNDDFATISMNLPFPTPGEWHNILMSVDLVEGILTCYDGDTEGSIPTPFWFSGFQFPFSTMAFGIGSVNPPIGLWAEFQPEHGPYWEAGTQRTCITEVWFAPGAFLDFRDPANRALFHDAGLRPVDLGPSGEYPMDEPPAIFLTGGREEIGNNLGSAGGTFNAVGVVVNSLIGFRKTLPPVPKTRGAVRFPAQDGGIGSGHGSGAPTIMSEGSFSVWLRMYAPQTPGFRHNLVLGNSAEQRFYIWLDESGLAAVTCGLVEPVHGFPTREVVFRQTDRVIPADGNWHHLAISWDLTALTCAFYVDRIVCSSSVTNTLGSDPFQLDFLAGLAVAIHSAGGGAIPDHREYVGDMAELWLDVRYFDFGINIDKFCTVDLHTTDLGGEGQLPTGIVPYMYLSQSPANYPGVTFGINRAYNRENGYGPGQWTLYRPVDDAPPPYP